MTTVLDWAEKAGIENMKDQVTNADQIQSQVGTLLTLLISGASAALYFSMQHPNLRITALAVSLWLLCLAIWLALKCWMYGDFPSVWNEPKNLNQKGYKLDALRQYELENLQQRITDAMNLNFTKTQRINKCILATCLATPVIGIIVWLVAESGFCALAQVAG